MTTFPDRWRPFWRRVSPWDRVALVFLIPYAAVRIGRLFSWEPPGSGFLGFLALIGAAYFFFRLLGWTRRHLLWSLRNKLIVAYLLIAVVPVMLLVLMAGLSAYVIYSQLGAYLIYEDLQVRLARVASIADAAATLATPDTIKAGESEPIRAGSPTPLSVLLTAAEPSLPGIELRFREAGDILRRPGDGPSGKFSGLVQSENQVSLRAEVLRKTAVGAVIGVVSVPVTSALVDTLAPELGSLSLTVTRPVGASEPQEGTVEVPGGRVRVERQINSSGRAVVPPRNWLDFQINGFLQLDVVLVGARGVERAPGFAFFSARPSQLNRRLLGSLGETGGVAYSILIAVGIIFLVIEVVALRTGVSLTRTITQSVDDLYEATQHVQAGNFSHRIRVQRKDQLGVLGESFNTMTGSISALIEEQRQRQRLESELSIAREVQTQLFPRRLPEIEGVELAAIWRAARVVSGDYYDFFALGPTRFAMVIADISGKGISAALLMASLQAALRSQLVLGKGDAASTAELVAHLNRHLYLNTSEERYATLFYAVVDTATRTLRYTNAGHLPPLYVSGDHVRKLEAGGMVVGLFDDCIYEQGTIEIEPNSLLIAYTDGLTEPENVYGEEFGTRRIIEEISRYRHAGPKRLAQALVSAAEEWAGSPEQADDITVVIAGLR
jgi:sigma-B regulation protein RsbU (phosphoserine phosphatase)